MNQKNFYKAYIKYTEQSMRMLCDYYKVPLEDAKKITQEVVGSLTKDMKKNSVQNNMQIISAVRSKYLEYIKDNGDICTHDNNEESLDNNKEFIDFKNNVVNLVKSDKKD